MDKYIKENLENFVLKGQFAEAYRLIVNLSIFELSNILCELADNSGNIIIYSFACYLLIHKETTDYHSIASLLLAQPLCFIQGAYSASLFHIRRCLELDPNNISYMESLLFFYRIPDQLVTTKEALKVAQAILKVDPSSKAALRVISDVMDFNTKIKS